MSVKFVSKFVHVKKIFFTNLHLQIYNYKWSIWDTLIWKLKLINYLSICFLYY